MRLQHTKKNQVEPLPRRKAALRKREFEAHDFSLHTMDTTSTRKIQIALKVLARQYDVKAQLPTPEEIETLKSLFGDRAGSMTLHEIARTVIERELPKKEERRIPPR